MRSGWLSRHWRSIPAVALAAFCFTAAQALGGSGFIACFTGGLLFGFLWQDGKDDLLGGATSTGEVLAMLTWTIFGGPVLASRIPQFTMPTMLYAVLGLTVIRMLPVFLCLAEAGLTTGEKLFVGWFGLRSIASIVFAIIVFNAGITGRSTVGATAVCTILLSVLAHGLTANPLTRAFGHRR